MYQTIMESERGPLREGQVEIWKGEGGRRPSPGVPTDPPQISVLDIASVVRWEKTFKLAADPHRTMPQTRTWQILRNQSLRPVTPEGSGLPQTHSWRTHRSAPQTLTWRSIARPAPPRLTLLPSPTPPNLLPPMLCLS